MRKLWKQRAELFYYLVVKRCALEGCRYGIEGIDKEPLDWCIYCGREREKGNFNFSLSEFLSKLESEENEKVMDTKRSD